MVFIGWMCFFVVCVCLCLVDHGDVQALGLYTYCVFIMCLSLPGVFSREFWRWGWSLCIRLRLCYVCDFQYCHSFAILFSFHNSTWFYQTTTDNVYLQISWFVWQTEAPKRELSTSACIRFSKKNAEILGSILEVDRRRSSAWGLIDHVDLGVLKGQGSKCRRVAPAFKRAVAQVARSLRGSGIKRPGQVLTSMHVGKRAKRDNHVLSRASGPQNELFEIWNYRLSMRRCWKIG